MRDGRKKKSIDAFRWKPIMNETAQRPQTRVIVICRGCYGVNWVRNCANAGPCNESSGSATQNSAFRCFCLLDEDPGSDNYTVQLLFQTEFIDRRFQNHPFPSNLVAVFFSRCQQVKQQRMCFNRHHLPYCFYTIQTWNWLIIAAQNGQYWRTFLMTLG